MHFCVPSYSVQGGIPFPYLLRAAATALEACGQKVNEVSLNRFDETIPLTAIKETRATVFTLNYWGISKELLDSGISMVSWQWDFSERLFLQRPWLLDSLPYDAILPCTMQKDVFFLKRLGFRNAFHLAAATTPEIFHPMEQIPVEPSRIAYVMWARFGQGLEQLAAQLGGMDGLESVLMSHLYGGRGSVDKLVERLFKVDMRELSDPFALPNKISNLLWHSVRDLARWTILSHLSKRIELTLFSPIARELWPSIARSENTIIHQKMPISYGSGLNRFYSNFPLQIFPGECDEGYSYCNPRLLDVAAAGAIQCCLLNRCDYEGESELSEVFDIDDHLTSATGIEAWVDSVEQTVAQPTVAKERAQFAYQHVLEQHTFLNRIEELLTRIKYGDMK